MSNRIISILCAGLIFLGLNVSICLGAEEFLQQLTNNRDLIDSSDNKQNLQLMQLIRQYTSNINNQNIPDEDSNEDESGGRRKRSVVEEKKNSPIMKRDVREDSIAEFMECGIGKRSVTLPKDQFDMGFKNRPGFRSWGGKRSDYVNQDERMKNDRGKDEKLIEIEQNRNKKFYNWGGKRMTMDDLEDFQKWNRLKRDTFRSWGGKRTVLVPPTLRTGFDSPSKFSNWGGKRFDREYINGYGIPKRDMEYAMPYEQENENIFEGKRGQFQSWGGKRFDRNLDGYIGERSGHVNWFLQHYLKSIFQLLQNDRRIGKKNIFGNKPLEDDGDLMTSGFSAWRGKR